MRVETDTPKERGGISRPRPTANPPAGLRPPRLPRITSPDRGQVRPFTGVADVRG